jgi:hypothetical protein
VFTINGFTEEELDRQRAARGNPTAGAIATLQTVADRLRSAVTVDDSEQQAILAQQSMGATGGSGAPSAPGELIRQAKMAAFQSSDAAKIPGLVVQERAAAVEEAQRKLTEVRGGMVQPGDAAQETRNERELRQVRMRLGDDAPITTALAELDRYAGDSNKLGLVGDELRAMYPQHSALIDQHQGRIDPQLAAAETHLRNEQRDFEIVKTVAAAVEKGIKAGSPPSAGYFDSIAKAVKRQ